VASRRQWRWLRQNELRPRKEVEFTYLQAILQKGLDHM
jgi:hypothetical protein